MDKAIRALQRLREPSSWAGIAALGLIVGLPAGSVEALGLIVGLPAGSVEAVGQIVGGVAALAAIFMPERRE